MSNSLTIHFHLKHFKESGLPFSEYMLLLLYEDKETWRLKELQEIFHLSDRTITRMRVRLYESGYLLKSTEPGEYYLSDKMYSK